ncbi:MAG: hypothetical protein PVH04_10765 [Gammaproteobacteria bacterium]|jgi:hypothetical protein
MSHCRKFVLRTTGVAAILLGIVAWATTVNADGLKDFVLSQLDGKGTVSSVNTTDNRIVIDDVSYVVSRTTTVFNVAQKRNGSLRDVQPGDSVGFRAKPLPRPTAPYDQNIVKIWILPSDG